MLPNVMLLCSSLVFLSLIAMPAPARGELAVPPHWNGGEIFEQIQDLELMRRNIEECYRAQQPRGGTGSAAHLATDRPVLDAMLLHRVFARLAGSPEYERFVDAYQLLIRHPDFRRRYAGELFGEYMRLLDAGRVRLLKQVNEHEEGLSDEIDTHACRGSRLPVRMMGAIVGRPPVFEQAHLVPAVMVRVQAWPKRCVPATAGTHPTTTLRSWSEEVPIIRPVAEGSSLRN